MHFCKEREFGRHSNLLGVERCVRGPDPLQDTSLVHRLKLKVQEGKEWVVLKD